MSHSQTVPISVSVWNPNQNVQFLDIQISDVKFFPTWDKKLGCFAFFRVINFIYIYIYKRTKLFSVQNPNTFVWISDIKNCLKSEFPFVRIMAFLQFSTFGFWMFTVHLSVYFLCSGFPVQNMPKRGLQCDQASSINVQRVTKVANKAHSGAYSIKLYGSVNYGQIVSINLR